MGNRRPMNPDRESDAGDIPETSAPRRTVADVTCLACGCLCDDLAVTVGSGSESVEVRFGLRDGRDWFLARGRGRPAVEAAVEGRPVETAEAIETGGRDPRRGEGAGHLGFDRDDDRDGPRGARTGGRRRGAGGPRPLRDVDLGRVAAFQDQGRVSATLGEVKNRADLVIFWGVDPLTTHPRHWERYSVEPRGTVRAGRTGGTDGRRRRS